MLSNNVMFIKTVLIWKRDRVNLDEGKGLRNLDIWEGQEVLGDVNNQLVHESRSNVVTIQ